MVRSCILTQEKEKEMNKTTNDQHLLSCMIQQFLHDPDMGIKSQLMDSLRMLLDVHLANPIFYVERMNAMNDVRQTLS
jgi:hypothetical protein